jgi:hypothetical protein
MRRSAPCVLLAVFAWGCCPTTAGPTAAAVSFTAFIPPGELRVYDVDTPSGTTQINLTFRAAPETVFRLLQIDPSCAPTAPDTCQAFADKTYTARPSGVSQFGDSLQPRGTRTRIALINPNPAGEVSAFVEFTVEPRRAGCT